MIVRYEIKTSLDVFAQMRFSKEFKHLSGIELYEHILVKKQEGREIVYTIMDSHSNLVFSELMGKHSIDIIKCEDCTKEILEEFYFKEKLNDFFGEFNLYRPEDYVEKFYQYNIEVDQILDKISFAGIGFLNETDKQLLNNY